MSDLMRGIAALIELPSLACGCGCLAGRWRMEYAVGPAGSSTHVRSGFILIELSAVLTVMTLLVSILALRLSKSKDPAENVDDQRRQHGGPWRSQIRVER